jgi:putative nucleotidyltransferase with HDIG domain
MLTYDQALALLARYGIPESRIEHCKGVSEFAYSLAQKISASHPELPVDPEKVRIAALLHDIGRSRPGDHELNSVAILREEGHPELADIVMHGSMYEISQLRGTDDPSLLPHSLENKIVAYADARFRLSIVTLEERFTDVKERHKNNPEKVASVAMGQKRFEELEKELQELTK